MALTEGIILPQAAKIKTKIGGARWNLTTESSPAQEAPLSFWTWDYQSPEMLSTSRGPVPST